MNLFKMFRDRSKKIAQGSFGTVYAPNYECPNFEKRKGYISKMMKSKKDSEYEIKQLKKIKKIDPKQKYLATFETSCASSQRKYYKNIIMKNFGNALILKKFKRGRTEDHIINVFMKQMLEAMMLLHKNGIYHKDVHDRNIVYSEEDKRYRLIDFGLSTTDKDIDETFKPKNVKYAVNIAEYFDDVILRGDGVHETFDFEGYDDLLDVINDVESKLLNLNKLASELKKAHAQGDVYVLFILAPFLSDDKKVQDKISDRFDKIYDESQKNKKPLTAKFAYDKLFNGQKGGALSNLTKEELLRRIRKYEKSTGNKSRISMKNKKQDMVNYLNQYKPSKKVRFVEKPKVIMIEGRTDAERKIRKKALKKIGKKKKELKQLKSIYYKEIPMKEHYIKIKTFNDTVKNKKLKKREPIKFVKGIDHPVKKRTIYEQTKWKEYKMKYKIYTKKNKVKLNIYDRKDPKNEKKIEKTYNFNKEDKYDKYRAEYDAKVDLIKYIRKVLKKT